MTHQRSSSPSPAPPSVAAAAVAVAAAAGQNWCRSAGSGTRRHTSEMCVVAARPARHRRRALRNLGARSPSSPARRVRRRARIQASEPDPRHPNIGSYELNALTRLLSAMLSSRKQSWLAYASFRASDRRDAALLSPPTASRSGATPRPAEAPDARAAARMVGASSFATPILLRCSSLWELHTVHEGGIFARAGGGGARPRTFPRIATDRATQSLFAERLRARLAALGATGLTAAPDGRLAADIAHDREADSFEAVPACLQPAAPVSANGCSYPVPCSPGEELPYRTAHSVQRCGRSIEPPSCGWPRCCAASPPTRRSRRRSGPRRPARHGRTPQASSESSDNSIRITTSEFGPDLISPSPLSTRGA